MSDASTRKLKLEVDGTDYSDEVSDVQIVSAAGDTDFLSFAAAAGTGTGGSEYTLHIVMKQALGTTTLWRKIWAESGTDVDVVVRPIGGTTAGTATPQFLGTVTIAEPAGVLLGGAANASNTAKFTTEVDWPFLAKPTLDETP